MAESIFRHKVQLANLDHTFLIDSAGTGDWHVGDNPDPRTIRVLREMGIEHFSRARQVHSRDFEIFDHLIAMDAANVTDLRRWPGAKPDKVSLMLNWGSRPTNQIVPDPYYGDHQNFVEVSRMLDHAADELLVKLREIHQIGRTD